MKILLRSLARKYPSLKNLYRSMAFYLSKNEKYRMLRNLSKDPNVHAGKVASAIKSLDDARFRQREEWPDRIEMMRNELLSSDDPLVEGDFGDPGIYDGGSKTIKSCCTVSKPPREALFLYCLTKSLKSKKVLELGTNLGISSAYLAAGMKHGDESGRLITCEASPYRQRIANQVHKKLGLENVQYVLGMFSETLNNTLEQFGVMDFAFIDGHHKYQATLDYLNKIVPYATEGCVFLFDDIRWSEGMKKAWDEIRADERFSTVIDLETVGLCVLGMSNRGSRSIYGPVKIF